MRVRDVLQRAVANRPMPESIRANILRTLRDSQRRSLSRVAVKRWALGLAAAAVVLFGVFAAEWLNLRRGEQLIASILKLGVSDHIVCAVQGHNYPDVGNPPDQIRESLALDMPLCCRLCSSGFQVLNFSRAYLFDTRKRPQICPLHHARARNILSVILAERNGAALPETNSSSVRTQAALVFTRTTSAGWKSRA